MHLYFSKIISQSSFRYFGYKTSELYFVGCNFNCGYCHVGDILLTNEQYSLNMRVIQKEILTLSKITEALLITGGEPTLQKEALIHLLQYGKKLNLKTGVHTNGSKPEVIKHLIELKLLDFIVLDIKCPPEQQLFERITRTKSYFSQGEEVLKKIGETLVILKQSGVQTLLVTVLIPSLLYKVEELYKIAEQIKNLDCTWELRGFRIQGELNDQKFKTLSEPTQEFLDTLKELVKRKYPQINVSSG